MFDKGEGGLRDPDQAVLWYRKAAEQGDKVAITRLEELRRNADNEMRSQQDTRELEELERETEARNEFFAAYDRGDYETAHREALTEAQRGRPWAQYLIGVMYARGEGVPQDYAEAARWYRKAAEQGHADAQFNLGSMYFRGEGVEQHPGEAGRWARVAAEQGHEKASELLAFVCAEGWDEYCQ